MQIKQTLMTNVYRDGRSMSESRFLVSKRQLLVNIDNEIPEEFRLIQKFLSVCRYCKISLCGFFTDKAMVGVEWTTFSANNKRPAAIFIAGRPKAALLLWFFGDFRYGALLFVVIHVIYKYRNRLK